MKELLELLDDIISKNPDLIREMENHCENTEGDTEYPDDKETLGEYKGQLNLATKIKEALSNVKSEKEIREMIANDISADLKGTMENLCGLARDGYNKVSIWHAGFINTIVNGKKNGE